MVRQAITQNLLINKRHERQGVDRGLGPAERSSNIQNDTLNGEKIYKSHGVNRSRTTSFSYSFATCHRAVVLHAY